MPNIEHATVTEYGKASYRVVMDEGFVYYFNNIQLEEGETPRYLSEGVFPKTFDFSTVSVVAKPE